MQRGSAEPGFSGQRAPLLMDVDESACPTLGELLSLAQFAEVRLLSCRSLIGERRVWRTSVQEIPLEDFARSGELVMTTGIGLSDDEAQLTGFVQQIARTRAAALAVALDRHIARVPERAVLEAERHGLPLLVFPCQLRFTEITEVVLAHVVDRQHEWLRRSDKMHRLFTKIVLGGRDLAHLCRVTEQLLDAPMRVINRWGEETDAGEGSRASQAPRGWEDRAARIAIEAEHHVLGTLLVGADRGSPSDLDAMVVRHAAIAAALIMRMERAEADGEVRRQSGLVAAVLIGTGSTREIERRAISLGFESTKWFVAVHLSFATNGTDRDFGDVGRWAVERALSGRRTIGLQAWEGPEATLLLAVSSDPARATTRSIIADIETHLGRQGSDLVMTCGLSGVSPDLTAARESIRQAVTACRLGMILNGPGSVTDYADLGAYPALYEALFANGSGPAFEALEARYLGAALRYEADSGLPLIDTLSAFFSERGNVSATARKLRINRQSLLYRLGRFQSISDVDLDSPAERFAVELAIRCLRMRGRLDPRLPRSSTTVISDSVPRKTERVISGHRRVRQRALGGDGPIRELAVRCPANSAS
jgi:purine catabolism regulator